ncbi:MAG: glutathione S-transferase family protein [Scytolyngbya sp. HA4215-MV1]|jgi:glutathione S-transferase|nr:glutathione S-transferase family protein [Scytolyngbya sp. HA4215-MV1]
MLKLYHAPISPNSRRVWITLLEKGLAFELIEVKLHGDQFTPEFLAINPFHHIPVLVDDGFNVVESLAILDYLEAKYPAPAMLPQTAHDLAIVRMVELTAVNELLPAATVLAPIILGFPGANAEQIEQAIQKVSTVLNFYEGLLDERPFFGSETLTLAEPVAGTVIPWLLGGSLPLGEIPKLKAWCDRIQSRSAWQTTQATPEMVEELKTFMAARMSPASGS